MEGTYSVSFGGQTVGKVIVSREGLYYRFCCRCRITGDVVCKVVVYCGGIQESLGILAPVGVEFGLKKKVAARRFPNEKPEFRVVPSRPDKNDIFIPIKPEEPFAYIEKLKDAYLVRQNGILGVIIKESAEV